MRLCHAASSSSYPLCLSVQQPLRFSIEMHSFFFLCLLNHSRLDSIEEQFSCRNILAGYTQAPVLHQHHRPYLQNAVLKATTNVALIRALRQGKAVAEEESQNRERQFSTR